MLTRQFAFVRSPKIMYNLLIMEKKTDLRSKWVVITAGTNIFDAEFRAGALELAHEHGFHNIRLRIDGEILKRDYLKSELFRSGNGGIICHPTDVSMIRYAAKAGTPMILLGEWAVEEWRTATGGHVAICSVDNEGIGQLAADYLYGQHRFKSFVFADYTDDTLWNWWSTRRYKSFATTITAHGHVGEVRHIPVSPSTPDEDAKHFIEDIKDLPRPIAVFACNDIVAKDVVDFLELASVRIPSEVAVLGVDDQREICETAAVKLSSIRVEHKRLGRTAMTLMLRMLQGGEHHDKTILCPAVRVIERESTRRLAPSNPRVAAALDFIRATDPRKLSAENVSAASNSSHSYLSKSFKRETGMTIMDAIHEKILDETKRLLTETDIPVAAIAEEMGFNNPSGLYALFKRKTGSTMSEFRKNRPLL